jgi:hypothetical protein
MLRNRKRQVFRPPGPPNTTQIQPPPSSPHPSLGRCPDTPAKPPPPSSRQPRRGRWVASGGIGAFRRIRAPHDTCALSISSGPRVYICSPGCRFSIESGDSSRWGASLPSLTEPASVGLHCGRPFLPFFLSRPCDAPCFRLARPSLSQLPRRSIHERAESRPRAAVATCAAFGSLPAPAPAFPALTLVTPIGS